HSTKSGRNRVVPISEGLKSLLLELRSLGSFSEKLRFGKTKKIITLSDLVLPRLNAWKKGNQAKVIERFCRKHGITSIKFHDLRATFITNLLAQGVSLVTVMSIVGHSDMATTDRYLRLAGVNVKGATSKLSYALPKAQSAKVIPIFRQKSSQSHISW
ncbi:MAG: hypothetical protein COV44_02320, partial [Deltaproteobacteria bacterium CG11_big_fil_rev_8_21_14_0_20_45_16]